MKQLLRSALSDLTYRAMRLARKGPQGLRILMYHRVTDAHPSKRLCVPVARFAEQMRWLNQEGYRTITFREAIGWVTSDKRQATSKTVVLTFDDGYEDNFIHAAHIMQRYGFVGTFFIPSAFIAAGPNGHPAQDRPMTWQQLKELAARGHEIGAHSVSHAKLSRIPEDQVVYEVRRCKEDLEAGLGQPVRTFCYPSGDYNRRVRNIVQANGYAGACTVEPGANRPGTDPFVLTRTEISAFDSLWDFQKKMAGAYDWLHAIWQTLT